MKTSLRTFLLGLLAAVLPLGNAVSAADTAFTLAVVPQFAALQVHRDWTPLLARLEQATGYRFELRAYDKVARFEEDVLQGIPDLAFMNPYHMVMARKSHGYRPLVRDDAGKLSGVLVVRREGAIRSLADLNDKEVAFPAPNAFGASLYMRALLAEKEGIKIRPVYVGNHENVHRQIALGDVAAGGAVQATFDREPEALRAQLKIIYNTPGAAPHPLAAHPRVPEAAGNKISEAMLALGSDPEGRKLLAAVQMPQPVKADYQRDYAHLTRLKLENYVAKPQQ